MQGTDIGTTATSLPLDSGLAPASEAGSGALKESELQKMERPPI